METLLITFAPQLISMAIDAYVTRKIEERVLASKADQPGQALPIIN